MLQGQCIIEQGKIRLMRGQRRVTLLCLPLDSSHMQFYLIPTSQNNSLHLNKKNLASVLLINLRATFGTNKSKLINNKHNRCLRVHASFPILTCIYGKKTDLAKKEHYYFWEH